MLGCSEAADVLHEALVILLYVAEREILVRVLESDVRVFVHPSFDDGHLVSSDLIAYRKRDVAAVIDFG